MKTVRLLTVGEIAKRTGEPPHRIIYVIRSRRIQPQAKAGPAYVYSDESAARIQREIARIDAECGRGVEL